GVAAAPGSAGAAALRARRRFRLRGAYLAGAAWRVRRRRARKRQSPIAVLAQGRHSRPAARPYPVAEHDPPDCDRAQRIAARALLRCRMSNRSHRNSGHIGMNMLRKQGLSHSSARIAAAPTQEPTSHVIAVADCLEVLERIPTGSIQLVVCDPPYNINVA